MVGQSVPYHSQVLSGARVADRCLVDPYRLVQKLRSQALILCKVVEERLTTGKGSY